VSDDPRAFVLSHASPTPVPLVPELRLFRTDDFIGLWEQLGRGDGPGRSAPPPYWAAPWAGGQALARYVLDRPETVRGRRVLDFGSGSGLVGIAAARAGAAEVVAIEIDAIAGAAIAINAALNDVTLTIVIEDWIGRELTGFDLLLAGDICYEGPMSQRAIPWLRRQVAKGVEVLLADPGRAYRPESGYEVLGVFDVPTAAEESIGSGETSVLRLHP